jgi:WD40 repeat protein
MVSKDKLLAAGASHGTICIFDAETGKRIAELEGHTRVVRSLSFSCDGTLLASKSDDGTVRVSSASDYNALAVKEPVSGRVHGYTNKKGPGIAFHPKKLVLATLGDSDQTVRIWNVETDLWSTPPISGVRYTTAKVVLVVDKGVGKTGLGWRLARGNLENIRPHTDSSFGFWTGCIRFVMTKPSVRLYFGISPDRPTTGSRTLFFWTGLISPCCYSIPATIPNL